MPRFESAVLDLLPEGNVFDGELVVLDEAGRPLFGELMFGRRRPTYVAFDLLESHGEDLRSLQLRERKARLAAIGKGAESWIALTNGLVGDGCALYRAVVAADLEGIVANRLTDAYHPKQTRWHKFLVSGINDNLERPLRRPTATKQGAVHIWAWPWTRWGGGASRVKHRRSSLLAHAPGGIILTHSFCR